MKRRLQAVLANARVQAVLSWLIAGYLRLVFRTSHWDLVDLHYMGDQHADGRPVLACFWHGRLTMMPFIRAGGEPFTVLCSPSRDGKLSARTQARLGLTVVMGNTKRPIAATRTLIQLLRAGANVAVTPDGPRGPRMRAKPGLIAIARAARVPITPLAFAVRRRVVLNSWDRQVVPLPFNRGVLIAGAPIEVGEGDTEVLRAVLEARLNELTAAADRRLGVVTPSPAPIEGTVGSTHARA